MVIIYDCELTEPPSEISCFRDITLFTEIFLNADNLIKCPKGTRSMYWDWIKGHGAHDFISQLLEYGEEQSGLIVASKDANVKVKLINEYNYGNVINILRKYKG